MWLWKKFWNTDIIGKIYILIILFIVIVATITVIVRYNKAKPTNETVEGSIYENEISMTNKNVPIENTNQESQIENEVINNLNNIEEQKNAEVNNTNTVVAKKENKINVEKNVISNKKETVKEKQKPQDKEVAKEKTITQPQKEKTKQEQNYAEYEVNIAEKEECKNNKHWIATGNCQKWFKTKNEANSYYDSVIAKWGRKWENDEISYEEYLKNCPSRI